MKYNNRITQGLGITPYVITSAVRSDVSVCCMYYAKKLKTYFEEIAKFCNYHLDCRQEFFSVANVVASPNEQYNTKLSYTTLPNDYVLQSLLDEEGLENLHVFCALDNESVVNACKAIEDSLAGNVQYMV